MNSNDLSHKSNRIPFYLNMKDLRITCIGNSEVLVENLRKIVGYSENEIVVSDGRKRVCIKGSNLRIVSFGCFDAKIIGCITSLEWVII